MRRFSTLLVIFTTCSAWIGCNGSNGVRRPIIAPDELARANLAYYWPNMAKELPLPDGQTLRYLKLLDENLYCMTDANLLLVVDAASGAYKWSYQVAPEGTTVFEPTHASNVLLSKKPLNVGQIMDRKPIIVSEAFDAVVINTIESMLLLDRSTGKLYRRIPFTFAANSTGVSDGQSFYVGSTSGKFYAFTLNAAVQTWTLRTGGMISAPLSFFNGLLYVTSTDRHFYCVRAGERGTDAWKQRLDGTAAAAFHVDQRGCFVPCLDNRLYAFDAARGHQLWEPVVCQGPLRDPVQVGENTVFQYARGDGFYAIRLTDGQQRWHLPGHEPVRVVAVADGKVYLAGQSGKQMLVVDEMLGKIEHKLAISQRPLFAGNAAAGVIYAATPGGWVYCIRQSQAGRLTAAMLRGES